MMINKLSVGLRSSDFIFGALGMKTAFLLGDKINEIHNAAGAVQKRAKNIFHCCDVKKSFDRMFR